ncbi:MAG: Endonuclease [Parcubacteria group bacterium]|nr:Endonuclease [Parcubacteria group bacterium]
MESNNWNVSPKDAIGIQKKLQNEVVIAPLGKEPKTIAGADVSLNMFEKDIYAGIIVLSYPELVPIESSVIKSRTDFPYIPGLLSFREIPALLECFEQLKTKPDLIMVDGQGIAHPRRLGIASHFGVLIDTPTIGVAKSRLYGQFDIPELPGAAEAITDPKTGEKLGYALKSKARSNPLIISPGHRVSVEEALLIARTGLRGYRIPEPTRLAHGLVNAFRKGEDLSGFGKGSV